MYKKAALLLPFALMSQLSLADWIKDAAQQNENQVIQLRQHIHQNPELGNMEFKTSALVQKELKKMKKGSKEFVRELDIEKSKMNIQRFKGLGEMNPEELGTFRLNSTINNDGQFGNGSLMK